ncbi:hypothetical protein [Pseudoclavibacter helvolus]|uniref:hypothetical protein n=1 Tax=Pseudoclavibacter helvolus TaxID=255205 RepID=UPI003C74D5F3
MTHPHPHLPLQAQPHVHPHPHPHPTGAEQHHVAGQSQIVYVKRPATGASYWLVGLTVLVPLLGWIVGPTSMISSSARGLASDDAFQREVARNASNWGKTMLGLVAVAAAFFAVSVGAMADSTDNSWMLITSTGFLYAIGTANLVGIICGGVSASQGRAFRYALAIPFRAREADFHVA